MDTLRSVAHLQREAGDELFNFMVSSDYTRDVISCMQKLRAEKLGISIFSVDDHFNPRNPKAKEAGIIWLGNNFQKWFLPLEEEITGEIILPEFHHNLSQNSLDKEILKGLGGKTQVARTPSTMRGIYEMIKKQPHGEDGALKNDGCANIFYVRDKDGALRAMDVYWDVDGWFVGAYLVSDPLRWLAGSRVFAGNS